MPNVILPEAQAYSDSIMAMRVIALELKKAVLEMESKRVLLQSKLMADDKVKIMAMDSGDIEEACFGLASCYGTARKIHKMANDLGRRLNVEMPAAPVYDPEYAGLYTESVSVRLSAPARR